MNQSLPLSCTVHGEPRGMGRPRSQIICPKGTRIVVPPGGRPAFVHVYTDKKDEAYMAVIEASMRAHRSTPFEGPVSVLVRAVFGLPATRERARKPPDRAWHAQKPDAENVAKMVLDAGTRAGWWKDDAQVARLVVEKVMGAQGENPGVHVTAKPLPPYREVYP